MNKDIQKWLAETLQEAFPGIPIYTGETMDNEQERNEHFKGFARILMQEVDEKNRAKAQSTGRYLDEEELHLLIAQRAYDLASHTINALWPYINDKAIEPSASDIPDLTEWPKTASEASAPDE